MDIIKSLIKKKGLVETGVFLFDQVVHLIIIFVLWNRFNFTNNNYLANIIKSEINRNGIFIDSTYINEANLSYLLIVIIIVSYVCLGGDILISKTLEGIFNKKGINHPVDKEIDYLAFSREGTKNLSVELTSALHEVSVTEEDAEESKEKSEKAGRYIGILERVIIIVLVVTNSVSSIVFVLTAKSVARFKELGETKLSAEYYLIGTLLSTLIALIGGFLIKSLSI